MTSVARRPRDDPSPARFGRQSGRERRGYGRFGARVVMAGSPCFERHGLYDPRRIRLADVDGSGPTDLIYLGGEGVDVYVNQAGNALAPRQRLSGFPPIDNVAQVSVVDLLGDGTGCLVWSSPLLRGSGAPLRYVRLMANGKPHLLKTIDNGLGRTTTLTYTPSTAFYTSDRRAGKPWATKLPFPVQCLSKVEVRDGITGWRFAQTYSYHHGYFDGPEREFRGFGLVVQRDTESVSDFEGASNGEVAQHVPPVMTKTWFHTGAWRGGKRLTDAYADEAWAGDPLAAEVRAPSIPSGLSPQDRREATRALKGVPLRVEVYAEDGSADADKPYTVTTSSYQIRQVQARGKQRHGVYQVIPTQTRSAHYERNAEDPRVSHELVLETDAYGQVLTAASVGYKRRAAQITAADPPSPVDVEQGRTHVVITTGAFLHDDEDDATYHLSVPIETETFELTGIDADDTAPFTVAGLLAAFEAADEIAFEAAPTGGTTVEKRRLSRLRTTYWNDALTGALAFGELGARALPYQSYEQVYTASLVGASGPWGDINAELGTGYDRPTTSGAGNDLELAGYVQPFSGNPDWWRPSGKLTLDSAAFYQPIAHTDPFGNTTTIAYDDHDLLVEEITDAVGNVVASAHDYRVLAPWEKSDPNGVKQQVAFDALGRVVKLAVIGAATPTPEGDTLEEPTVAFTYEVDRWADSALPNRVKLELRQVHKASGFQVQYAYSDGGGEVVMTKVQAKPGLAPERDEHGELVFVDEVLQLTEADPRWIGTGRTVVDNKGNRDGTGGVCPGRPLWAGTV
ncbi:MAG: toxin, partial [Deltaproteobacteria bacterium]